MANIILPDDPEWKQPLIMGDAYKQALTPKLAAEKRVKELDAQREAESGGTFKYATSGIAHHPDPWMKTAQMTGVSNMMTQPMWFSPLHTPQNWQIASKRREIYQWDRFFYENEPKVAAAIDFYCFTPETEILLHNESVKTINKIQIGDLVRSHDGTINKVVNKFRRHIDETILEIEFDDGKIRTTKEHKILVSRNGIVDYIHAGDLVQSDWLLTPRGYKAFKKESTIKKWQSMLQQLHDKKVLTTQTLLEELTISENDLENELTPSSEYFIYRRTLEIKPISYMGYVYDI